MRKTIQQKEKKHDSALKKIQIEMDLHEKSEERKKGMAH